MSRGVYRIAADVTGEAYKRLLDAALKEATTFSIVLRDQLQFDSSAFEIRDALRHLQVRHLKRDRWPGTILIGHNASVVTYGVADEALPVLLKPGSLFSWRSPAYPEDLSFAGADGGVCLATVSHEREGWIFSRSLARAVALGKH
jgi:hypothetical protein